jgi:acyl-homoserine lactone acylase PvdQ
MAVNLAMSMALSTAGRSQREPMRLGLKLFPVLTVVLSLCAKAQAYAGADDVARKAVAVVSGELRVPGLHKPVRVLRDTWGVAHIYAQNPHDLFFAQGVVAAQDRLFQMEVWKRAGQGRLSEILGPSALPRDINARALQYRGDMRTEYASYSPDTQAILTAFTDGINAYVATSARQCRHADRVSAGGIRAGRLASAGLSQSHGGLFHDG